MTTTKNYIDRRWTGRRGHHQGRPVAARPVRGSQRPSLVIAALGFLAALILIRTRDSRAHLEMANSEAAPA
jgi:hypothetical protein